jgi:hypothetical protein
MLCTCAGVSELSTAVVIPEAAKAASSGANTVNGPEPLSVVCRPALFTAELRTENEELDDTTLVMVLAGCSSLSFLQEAAVNITPREKINNLLKLIFVFNIFN